jgi:hypothetical protein
MPVKNLANSLLLPTVKKLRFLSSAELSRSERPLPIAATAAMGTMYLFASEQSGHSICMPMLRP